MNIVAILNYDRPLEYVYELIKQSLQQSERIDCLIVSTNNKLFDWPTNNMNPPAALTLLDNSDFNVAEAKNSIIEKAISIDKAAKLFIIEDDVDICSNETFKSYRNTMIDLNLGVIFSCYTNKSNYVLTVPSPRVDINMKGLAKNISSVNTNRHEAGDFMLIDLEKNTLLFDTSLKYFEFSEYVFRCWKVGCLPALNQFIDIPNSWDLIKPRKKCISLRKYNEEALTADKKRMDVLINNAWKIENDIKIVVDYIRKQLGV